MTSQLPRFWFLFLSYQLQKNIENGTAVTSLRPFLFRDDFRGAHGMIAFNFSIRLFYSALQICNEDFTFVKRRHHCRACGHVVCGNCSSQKAPLRYLRWESVRACDKCFDQLFEGKPHCLDLDLNGQNTRPHQLELFL